MERSDWENGEGGKKRNGKEQRKRKRKSEKRREKGEREKREERKRKLREKGEKVLTTESHVQQRQVHGNVIARVPTHVQHAQLLHRIDSTSGGRQGHVAFGCGEARHQVRT